MNQNSRWMMVAEDLFKVQGVWTIWYIGIFFLIGSIYVSCRVEF